MDIFEQKAKELGTTKEELSALEKFSRFTFWRITKGQAGYEKGIKLLTEYLGENPEVSVANGEWVEALKKWCEV